jgi:hypothetical protein
MATVVLLGLVNWIATTIVVESEFFRPLRDGIAQIGERRPRHRAAWEKASYLVGCHLCTGTWIGLVQALVFGSPWAGVPGLVAGGLVYKALGHLTLELRPQAWVRG